MAESGASPLETVKVVKELLEESDGKSRATPLQVLGRGYLLTLGVLSAGAAGSGYLDYLIGSKDTSALHCISMATTILLRLSVVAVACIGIYGAISLFGSLRNGTNRNGWLQLNSHPADLHSDTVGKMFPDIAAVGRGQIVLSADTPGTATPLPQPATASDGASFGAGTGRTP